MSYCPSCGGALGRDCFNPVECAQITASMNSYNDYDTEILAAMYKQKNPDWEEHLQAFNRAKDEIYSTNLTDELPF